jgi:hypothetical protein
VLPSRELAVQAAQAICSKLGLEVSKQVGCMVWWCRLLASCWLCRLVRRPRHLLQAGAHSLCTGVLYGVVVSPSCELAVLNVEAARAICSRLALTVSVQVGCGLSGVVVSPSCKLAVQTGEAARAICSKLGVPVSVQVGCMVLWCHPLVSWLCRPVRRPGPVRVSVCR